MIKTAEKARNINKINNVVFTAESDISKTDYFSMHFGVVNKIVVLPFLVSKRFQVVEVLMRAKTSCRLLVHFMIFCRTTSWALPRLS